MECQQNQQTQIFIKTLVGRTITLDVEPIDTIRDIKERIQDQEGLGFFFFFLIFAGKKVRRWKNIIRL